MEFLAGDPVDDIRVHRPNFAWTVQSTRTGDILTACRVIVASSTQRIAQFQGDMWDSGKVEYDPCRGTTSMAYRGQMLEAGCAYFWAVKTWCDLEGESPWSAAMRFRMSRELMPYATSRHTLVQEPIAPVRVKRLGPGNELLDFGKVAFGYLTLQVASPCARTIRVCFAERGDAQAVNRNPGGTVRYYEVEQPVEPGNHRYTIRPPGDERNTGPRAIPLPEAVGTVAPFRYVELMNLPGELDAAAVRQVAVHYPFDDSAACFTSSEPVLNEVWELCKYSMKATSFCGVYVDGDRERIPYEADAYINQLSHYAVDREFSIARFSHEYLLDHPTWPTEWKFHSIMMAWADHMYSGDARSVAQHYDKLKTRLLEEHARSDGLLQTVAQRPKGARSDMGDIVDWPPGERDGYDLRPLNTVVNAFYLHGLRLMSDLAGALEKTDEAKAYAEKAKRLTDVFNRVFFDAAKGMYIDGEGSEHASLHANMFPLAFGLVPPERVPAISDVVASRGMACSVYGAQYLLEALYLGGRADIALQRMISRDIRSWYNMIRAGSTITFEAWDDRFKPNQDWNHAWGAVPGNIIARYLMGVRPMEPGFGKVLIAPEPATLKHAAAQIPTIRGPIGVSFKNEPGRPLNLEVDLPVGVTARVRLPALAASASRITLDGRMRRCSLIDGRVVIDNVGSGHHRVVAG